LGEISYHQGHPALLPTQDDQSRVIPPTANHLRRILQAWAPHEHEGRPHMAWGSGLLQPPPPLPMALPAHRRRLPAHVDLVSRSILGGLHHDERLENKAA
jgi:hypothetical protein